MSSDGPPPLTESPWFWALLFASFALALVLVFGDKYRQRQSQLERQFQSKQLRDARQREDGSTNAKPEFSSPDNLILPLWPLAAFLAATAVLSGLMLVRTRRTRRTQSTSHAVSPHLPRAAP